MTAGSWRVRRPLTNPGDQVGRPSPEQAEIARESVNRGSQEPMSYSWTVTCWGLMIKIWTFPGVIGALMRW